MLILSHGVDIEGTQTFASVDSALPRKPDLEDFWKLESIGVIDDPKTTDDEIAMTQFKETLKFDQNRYQVTWPWKSEIIATPRRHNSTENNESTSSIRRISENKNSKQQPQ